MKNRKTKIAVAAAVSLIAAGTGTMAVSAYLSGNQFQPGNFSQLLQANQIVFPEDADKAGKQESDSREESSVWEKVDDAKRQEQPKSTGGAGYLLENHQNLPQTSGDNLSIATTNSSLSEGASQGGAVTASATAAAAAGGDTSYRLVGDPTEADLVIRAPEGAAPGAGSAGAGSRETSGTEDRRENGNGGGSPSEGGHSGSSGSSGNGGNASSGKKDDLVLEPDPGKKPTPSPDPAEPGKPSTPENSVKDPELPAEKPAPGAIKGSKPYPGDMSGDEAASNSVLIIQGDGNWRLYRGQNVAALDAFYALDAGTWKKGDFYAWGTKDYGKYIRMDGISFDGGKTWQQFPAVIPDDLKESIVFKVSYRYSEKDDWTTLDNVQYEVQASRIFVLSKKLEEDSKQLDSADILNSSGDTQYLAEGDCLNLYGLQNKIYGSQDGSYIYELFPGWTENGEKVSWIYPATVGRHILEPEDMVSLDSSYLAKLKGYFLDENGEVTGSTKYRGVLQTLEGYWGESGSEQSLEVPQYIQAVDFTNFYRNIEVGKISIPDTVVYVNSKENLLIHSAWEVEDTNPVYSSDQNGFLYDKEKTALLGIPYDYTEVTIPFSVQSVTFAEENLIQKLVLKAESERQLPDMDMESLSDCQVQVEEKVFTKFLKQHRENFTSSSGNTICSSAEPEQQYMVQNDFLLSQDNSQDENQDRSFRQLLENRSSIRLPKSVTSIEENAFAETPALTTIRLSEMGTIPMLEKDCFAGSSIRKIVCYTKEQKKQMEQQLAKAGAGHAIDVELLGTEYTKDGFSFVRETVDGKTETILTSAPKGLTDFDSATLKDQSGADLNVTSIADGAFAECRNLKWVTLSENVAQIGAGAFENCAALEGVLIQNKEQITIGDQAFSGCTSLRFLASNAEKAVMENDYAPKVSARYNDEYIRFFYVPTEWEGYPAESVICFTKADHVTGYQMVKTGENGRVLYGMEENTPWIALRSGSSMDAETSLPGTTKEVFQYAFADAEAASGASSWSLNWKELPSPLYLDDGALYNSQLGGNVHISGSAWIGKNTFSGCTRLEEIWLGQVQRIGELTFANCPALTSLTFGKFEQGAAFPAFAVEGDSSLRSITLTDSSVMPITIHSPGSPFHFDSELGENEAQTIRIYVPEGTGESYIQEWQYLFNGYTDYADLYSTVSWDLIDWGTFEFPSEEAILAECERRLLAAENRIRTHLGMETVDKLTFPPEELQDLNLNAETDEESLDAAEAGKLKDKAAPSLNPDMAGAADTTEDGAAAGSEEAGTENPAADGSDEGATENPAAGDSGENISGEGSGENGAKADTSAVGADPADSGNSSSEENKSASDIAGSTDMQSNTQENLQENPAAGSDSQVSTQAAALPGQEGTR